MSRLFCAILASLAALGLGNQAAAAPRETPFQANIDVGPCYGADFSECKINFGVVPAGQRLEVTNVSCLAHFIYGYDLRTAQLRVLTRSGRVTSAVTLKPDLVVDGENSGTKRSSNDQVFAYAPAGQQFQVHFVASGHNG